MKIHKVGTVTFGCILVIFGILFLLHMFLPGLTYTAIFRLWPCILILLGIEVLLSNFRLKEVKFTYDTASIVLLIVLTFFAVTMAFVDTAMQHQLIYEKMLY